MTKKFYYLIKIEDDTDNANCSDYKIFATNKKGERLPCGICTPDKFPSMEMVEVIDDDQHDFYPCIFF